MIIHKYSYSKYPYAPCGERLYGYVEGKYTTIKESDYHWNKVTCNKCIDKQPYYRGRNKMASRPLPLVIDAMIAQIPRNNPNRDRIRHVLYAIKDSCFYTAPEAMKLRWGQVSDALCNYLGEPDTDWKKTISDIFADRLDFNAYL